MQSIDSIETYTYGTSKDLVSDREEIKCYKIIKRYNKKDQLCHKINDGVKENIKGQNPNWPHIPDHPYRILKIGGSGSGKTNSLLIKLTKFLINKRESTDLKRFSDSKSFIKYSNNMVDIYKNIEDYNPNKRRKILIVFDMILICLKIKNLIQ